MPDEKKPTPTRQMAPVTERGPQSGASVLGGAPGIAPGVEPIRTDAKYVAMLAEQAARHSNAAVVGIESLGDKFKALNDKFDAFIKVIDGRFTAFDGQFAAINGRLTGIEQGSQSLRHEVQMSLGVAEQTVLHVEGAVKEHGERLAATVVAMGLVQTDTQNLIGIVNNQSSLITTTRSMVKGLHGRMDAIDARLDAEVKEREHKIESLRAKADDIVEVADELERENKKLRDSFTDEMKPWHDLTLEEKKLENRRKELEIERADAAARLAAADAADKLEARRTARANIWAGVGKVSTIAIPVLVAVAAVAMGLLKNCGGG